MQYQHLADFDPSPFLNAPAVSLAEGLTLGKALLDRVPEPAPANVAAAAKALGTTCEEVEAAMIHRLGEGYDPSAHVSLDHAADGLWSLLRARIQGWTNYEREGLAFLEQDQQLAEELDVEELRARAATARDLSRRLFAAGLDFLRMRYTEQAQHMANLLGLIERDGLAQALSEVAGPELLPVLRATQRRYEAMVSARLERETGDVDLRGLRAGLQRVIGLYGQSVVSMLVTEGPEARERIEEALHPIVALRQRLAASRRAALTGEDIDAGLAQAQAQAADPG